MDLFSMRCFLSVTRHLNFSRAAEEMGITQPAMSVQIKKLEREIGAELLRRGAPGIGLTPAGQAVKKGFESMLSTYDNTLWQARAIGRNMKSLRVGYHGPMNWAGIQDVLYLFLKDNADVKMDVQMATYEELATRLESKRLDVAFVEGGAVSDRNLLQSVSLFEDGCCFGVSHDNPLARLERVGAREVQGKSVCYHTRQYAAVRGMVDMLLQSGITPENLTCIEQIGVSAALLMVHGGLVVLPRTFKLNDNRTVAYVDYDSPFVRVNYRLAWREDNANEAVGRFAAHCARCSWPGLHKQSL